MPLRTRFVPSAPDMRAKRALLEIVRIRFRAFESKFGREPKPDEPLFFDSGHQHPVKAELAEARMQIINAARQAKVDGDLVLAFLGLVRKRPQGRVERFRLADERTATGRHRENRSVQHAQPNNNSAWGHFLANQRLHRRYRITSKELAALSRVAFLGTIRDQRSYLEVLKAIRRQSVGPNSR